MRMMLFALVAALPLVAPIVHALPAPSRADERLLGLLSEDLDAQMRANPVWASTRGDRRFDRELPDVSPAGLSRGEEQWQGRLAALAAIDRAELSPENRLNAELLEHSLRDRLAAMPFRPEWTPLSNVDGPQIWLPQLPARLTLATPSHYEDYVARLRAMAGHLDQHIANMREGLRAGITPPRVTLTSVAQQAGAMALDAFSDAPETHPLAQPLLALDAGDPLRAAGLDVIRSEIVPAFARLCDFLAGEYVPGSRESIAASARPDGEAMYAYLVRHFTTTDLSPAQIHEIGLSEVARIRAEMTGVIARSDFPRKGELSGDALFAAFVDYLRNDPRFYHEDPEALLVGYRDICKRMDGELPLLFGRLPRLPYGVREMPRFMAPTAPTAFYYPGSMKGGVSGTFIANTHRLDQRPKYEMVALALHEAVPGHHLQIALANELAEAGLPEWRTTLDSTVYVEGWALYAEKLGLEAGEAPGSVFGGGTGLYSDPYDDFGRLSYEMWRALRLVVDTGMHAFGWTRERAIEYMLANSALTAQNVASEVDRYIAWPGQALAYKIGELKIMELRRLAERELGERFDRRAFHDAILETGAVTLGVLERHVRAWIEAVKTAE